jgi:hypothetical protein
MAIVRLLLLALALAACVTAPADRPIPTDVEGIEYETGPCFGACPVYRIALNADGSGLFEGRSATAVTGERGFRVTPAQYRAFAARLAPYQPEEAERRYSGPPLCERMATDLPSVTVTWHRPDGGSRRLYFYYGCDMERHAAMAEALRRAPDELPIGDLIGRRR